MADLLLYFVGVAFRLLLIETRLFGLTERSELASPINSYKRLKEGVVLHQNGLDPYSGVLFHETPIVLKVFTFLFETCNDHFINVVFVACDMLTAWLLGKVGEMVAQWLMVDQSSRMKEYHDEAKGHLLLKEEDILTMSRDVQVAYILHPYLIGSCAARTTTVFTNLILAFFLWACLKRRLTLATFFLAVNAYQSIYPYD